MMQHSSNAHMCLKGKRRSNGYRAFVVHVSGAIHNGKSNRAKGPNAVQAKTEWKSAPKPIKPKKGGLGPNNVNTGKESPFNNNAPFTFTAAKLSVQLARLAERG